MEIYKFTKSVGVGVDVDGYDLEIIPEQQVNEFGGSTPLKQVVEALKIPLKFEPVKTDDGRGQFTVRIMAKIMTYKGCTVYQKQDGCFYIHGIKYPNCGSEITLDQMFN